MSQRQRTKNPAPLAPPRQPLWTALCCAAILAAGLAAWSDSFNGPFIFDDVSSIQTNPTLRRFPAWENFVPPHVNAIARRPVVNFSFAANEALSGPGVRGFHAGNLLIHLLAALLLFGIVRRTLRTAPLREQFGPAASSLAPQQSASLHATGLALAVALIWTVHPLLTESVTYLTERTESLMGLFFLLTIYCFVRAAASDRPYRTYWSCVAVLSCALGMGAKEVMAAAPIAVLLYDRCFLSGTFREALRRRRGLYIGLAATWAILGALLIAYPSGGSTGAGFGVLGVTPWEYARSQPGVILHYLRLGFWPGRLCLDYGWPIATSAGQILPAAAVIAALLAATVWALRRAPALGFLGAWFFLILAPTSSFMPIFDLAVERRMYLPLAALVTACVLAAWWLGRKAVCRMAEFPGTRKRLGSVLAAVAVLAVAGALGVRTFERNAQYGDAVSIWQDAVEQAPWNSRAWNNLGCANTCDGHYQAAVGNFDRAIELNPRYVFAYTNRGNARFLLDQFAGAIADFDQAIALQPDFAYAYINRASVWYQVKQYDKAISDLKTGEKLGGQPPAGFVEDLMRASGRGK